jgi:hypothetical protein
MEPTLLNMVFVFSFFFLSVSLGLKWIGETIIQIILTRQGMEMVHTDLATLMEALEDEEDED